MPKRSLSSTLLAPQDVNRKSFVRSPRVQASSVPKPLVQAPQVVAQQVVKQAVHEEKPQPPHLSANASTAAAAAPQLTASRPLSSPPEPPVRSSKPVEKRVVRTKLDVPIRTVATRSAPRRLALRNGDVPLLRSIPITPPLLKDEQSATAKTKVRQPGSLRLVQFEDAIAPSDEIDFDNPDLFDVPATPAPAPVPAESFSPSPSDPFENLAPRSVAPRSAAEAIPSDSLFRDDTPPESVPTPQPIQSATPTLGENAETSASTTAPAQQTRQQAFPKTPKELQAEIEEALRDNPDLPALGDAPGRDGESTAPGDSIDLKNPLDDPFGEETDVPDSGRDLSATNGRDCESAQQACSDEMAFLRRRELTDMSVDITPSIEPREFDMTKVDEVRVEKLSKAPSRTWTDRTGQVIADGTFEDYLNGKVIVRTVNGTMRSIPDFRLSNEDRCFVNTWWELPDECHFEDEQFVMRDFRLTTFTWTAAATCHKPLYFEEASLERYGHTAGPIIQPLASGVHFFGNVAMMPYHMGLTPPNECIYPLGYYRPGECAPWIVRGFPMSTRGFKWQAFALGAGIALLP